MVLGGDDLVSVVALAGQVDVGQLVVLVDAALHSSFVGSGSAGFHLLIKLWRIKNINI